ncbi:MAG: sulfurtransferase, partial [Actinomycetota bacterium]|nr:sulfurtransferase [Actinomycetota bacterium]
MSEYANPHALVETDWLEQNLDDPSIAILEVDEDTTAYEKGHI